MATFKTASREELDKEGLIDRGDGTYMTKEEAFRLTPLEDDITFPVTFEDGTTEDVLYYMDPQHGDDSDRNSGSAHQVFKGFVETKSWDRPDGIHVDQDVPLVVRDGTTLYADIFRPVNCTEKIPAILAWGFYGKGTAGGGGEDDSVTNDWVLMGVEQGAMSNLSKVEGPDPMNWVFNGYAVVNVDGRGAGESGGNLCVWGQQDGQDGADVVDLIGEMDWCNGKVTLFGNSGLGMCQWFIAAEQPKHLACIAPWESTTDLYREFVTAGGIPWPSFQNMVMASVRSKNPIEDMVGMIQTHPLIDNYWRSKIPDFSKVTVPAYVAGGWCHSHLRGTIIAYRKCKSQHKWLRIHRDFEWPDNYDRDNQADLKLFYDRYCKDIHNCWESTPKVRIQVQDVWDHDYMTYKTADSFPIRGTKYTRIYMNASNLKFEDVNPVNGSAAKYDSTAAHYGSQEGIVNFDYKFDHDVELTGYFSAHLWVAAEDNDDIDMFFRIKKLNREGEEVDVAVVDEPYPGTFGAIRVSHRELDKKLSTKYQPVLAHTSEQKLKPGEIVPIDVEFYPTSRFWHAGESLRLEIAGNYVRDPNWFTNLPYDLCNKGNTIIYTGADHESWLQMPVVPPKYQDGDIVYR